MTNTTDQPERPDKALAQTLGFVAGDSVFVDTTPGWYSAFADEAGLEITPDLPATHAHLFFRSNNEFEEFLEDYKIKEVEQSIWFSWPSSTSGIKTNLTQQYFKDIMVTLGWIDDVTIAIDNEWSGLKFLRRKK